MALPIKETPVLTGNDAKKFLEDIKKEIKMSQEEKEHLNDVFKKFQKISNFKW